LAGGWLLEERVDESYVEGLCVNNDRGTPKGFDREGDCGGAIGDVWCRLPLHSLTIRNIPVNTREQSVLLELVCLVDRAEELVRSASRGEDVIPGVEGGANASENLRGLGLDPARLSVIIQVVRGAVSLALFSLLVAADQGAELDERGTRLELWANGRRLGLDGELHTRFFELITSGESGEQ